MQKNSTDSRNNYKSYAKTSRILGGTESSARSDSFFTQIKNVTYISAPKIVAASSVIIKPKK